MGDFDDPRRANPSHETEQAARERTGLAQTVATTDTPTEKKAEGDPPPTAAAIAAADPTTLSKPIENNGTAVSPEALAQFERDAQLKPADEVTVPGTDMTLAQLQQQQADHARVVEPLIAKRNDEALLRETSSVLTESKVTTTPEGQVISTPVSPPAKAETKSPE